MFTVFCSWARYFCRFLFAFLFLQCQRKKKTTTTKNFQTKPAEKLQWLYLLVFKLSRASFPLGQIILAAVPDYFRSAFPVAGSSSWSILPHLHPTCTCSLERSYCWEASWRGNGRECSFHRAKKLGSRRVKKEQPRIRWQNLLCRSTGMKAKVGKKKKKKKKLVHCCASHVNLS